MNHPKVSILMACYNGRRFIDRSFRSVLAQTWPSIELIFVDDGSTDDSYGFASSYLKAFERKGYSLILMRQDQSGACAAVVNAADHATGEFLQILDVDDYIMEDSCRLQAEYLQSNDDCDVVRTNGYVVQENNLNDKRHPLVNAAEDKAKRNIFMDLVTGKTNNWAGAYMVRARKYREFYSDKEFPISRYGQNLQFLLPLTLHKEAGFIDIPLFKYIRYVGSHSNQPSFEKQIENLNGYWDIRRRMLALLGIEDRDITVKCEIAYHTRTIDIALQFKKLNVYSKNYNAIKRLGGLTLELKAQNAIINNHLSQYPYRIAMALKRLVTT